MSQFLVCLSSEAGSGGGADWVEVGTDDNSAEERARTCAAGGWEQMQLFKQSQLREGGRELFQPGRRGRIVSVVMLARDIKLSGPFEFGACQRVVTCRRSLTRSLSWEATLLEPRIFGTAPPCAIPRNSWLTFLLLCFQSCVRFAQLQVLCE